MKRSRLFAVILWILLGVIPAVYAQGTSFVYQGKLSDTGTPQSGFFDFTFRLCSDSACTSQIGSTVTADDVTVTNGVFRTNLDFGSAPFSTGTGHYLEIAVRPGASTGAFTTLTPRQSLTSIPYAIQSLNATQLGGVAANQYVTTTNGGTTFIQNTTSPQPTSNFNISGTGSGNIFNATTQFNIGGNRILSGNSAGNVFGGRTAGIANTSGVVNSFFGDRAGEANAGGSSNSFFGERSGLNSQGINNSFFGAVAGQTNISGGNNTIIGTLADVGSSNLNFATAIGAGAVASSSNSVVLGRNVDTVQIPGNVGIGTESPTSKLTVAGTVESNSGGFKFPDGSTQTAAAANVTYTKFLVDSLSFINNGGQSMIHLDLPGGNYMVTATFTLQNTSTPYPDILCSLGNEQQYLFRIPAGSRETQTIHTVTNISTSGIDLYCQAYTTDGSAGILYRRLTAVKLGGDVIVQ
jgi:hypothetical protein